MLLGSFGVGGGSAAIHFSSRSGCVTSTRTMPRTFGILAGKHPDVDAAVRMTNEQIRPGNVSLGQQCIGSFATSRLVRGSFERDRFFPNLPDHRCRRDSTWKSRQSPHAMLGLQHWHTIPASMITVGEPWPRVLSCSFLPPMSINSDRVGFDRLGQTDLPGPREVNIGRQQRSPRRPCFIRLLCGIIAIICRF